MHGIEEAAHDLELTNSPEFEGITRESSGAALPQIHLNALSTRAQPNGQENQMQRFKIVDTGPAFTWYRETFLEAADRESAQEAYIEQCEEYGVVHGTLNVFRSR